MDVSHLVFAEPFAFTAAFVTLLGTPVLALVVARGLSRSSSDAQRRVFLGLVVVVVGVAAAASLGVSVSLFEANFIAACAAYAAFGVLALSAFRIRPKAVGVLAGVAGAIPLLLGLLLGTVGFLAVAFIVGDLVPIHVEQTSPNLRCYVYFFGNATTSEGGFDVTLSRQLPIAGFIEHLEHRQRFSEPSFQPAEACQRAMRGSND